MGNEDSIKEWKDMSIVRAEYSCVYDIDDKGIVNTNITFYNESGDKIESELKHYNPILYNFCEDIVFSGIEDNYPQDCVGDVWVIDIKLNDSNDGFHVLTSERTLKYLRKKCATIGEPVLTIQMADFIYDYIEEISGDWISVNVKYKNDTTPPDINYYDGLSFNGVIEELHSIFCDHLNEWEWEWESENAEPSGFGDYYSMKVVDGNGYKKIKMDVKTTLYQYETFEINVK